MERIRIGNDIKISWTILRDGLPEDFGTKKLTLTMTNHFGEKTEIKDYSLRGNVIEFTYYGKDQKYLGVHNFTLCENNGETEMATVDTCEAFALVNSTCETMQTPRNDVKLSYVKLSSDIKTGNDVIVEVKVDDTLESDSPTNALSARQGKILNEKMEGKQPKGNYALTENVYSKNDTYNRKEVDDKIIAAGKFDPNQYYNKDDADSRFVTREEVPDMSNKLDVDVYNQDKKNFTLKTELADTLNNYVKKVFGKDLSTNDFTNELKAKLVALSNYDDKEIRSDISVLNQRMDTLIGPGSTQAIDTFKEIENFLAGITDRKTLTGLLSDLKQEIVSVIPVSLSQLNEDAEHRSVSDTEKAKWNAKSNFSGSYNDLTDKPVIPTNTSQLKNNSNFVVDPSYNHTDNNYTTAEMNKLAGLKNYKLPIATTSRVGGVKVGMGMVVASNDSLTFRGRTFAGFAGLQSTAPDDSRTDLRKIFVIAKKPGKYILYKDSNGNPLVVGDGELAFFTSDNGTSWSKDVVSVGGSGSLPGYDDTELRNKIEFLEGVNNVSTLASLPTTKRSIVAEITSASTLSVSGLGIGKELYIRVFNASISTITLPIPNTQNYVSMSGNAVEIEPGSFVEMSVWCYANNKYSIRVGTME